MNNIIRAALFFLIIFTLISLLYACASRPEVAPATFEVISLNAAPSQAITGQEVTVTAQVVNTGGLAGNFAEPLMINGQQVASKVITMQPNTSKTLTYTISRDKPGKYILQLGQLSTSLNVKAVVEKELELKYDNDNSQDALWAGNNGGFLIDFVPSNKPFGIKKVRVCGGIYGTAWEGKTFELSILDSDMKSVIYNQVYAVSKFPVRGAFPYQPPLWTDFDIPPINLNDKFFVYLYTSMNKHHGIHVGIDDSIFNEHSQLAQGKPPYIMIVPPGNLYPSSIWYSDSTKVNWMIRAVGTVLVPSE